MAFLVVLIVNVLSTQATTFTIGSALPSGLARGREVLLEVVAHLLQDAEDLPAAHGRLRVARRHVGLAPSPPVEFEGVRQCAIGVRSAPGAVVQPL